VLRGQQVYLVWKGHLDPKEQLAARVLRETVVCRVLLVHPVPPENFLSFPLTSCSREMLPTGPSVRFAVTKPKESLRRTRMWI